MIQIQKVLMAKRDTRVLKDIKKWASEDSVDLLYTKYRALGRGVKLEKFKLRHGEKEGQAKWDEYKKKQAYSNSFEYKRKKHGWSQDDFDEYNKRRSCTKDNFIKRHGKEKGEHLWNEYVKRQAFTNSRDYLGERYERVNKLKAITLENMQRIHGEDKGQEVYENAVCNKGIGYSLISQMLFDSLKELFPNLACCYATYNKEYVLYDHTNKRPYLYDFVAPDIKLCIEYHGDHYHGNPEIYDPDMVLLGRGQKRTLAKDKWEYDNIKKALIEKERNYDMIIVWDSDYRKDPTSVLERLKYEIQKRVELYS